MSSVDAISNNHLDNILKLSITYKLNFKSATRLPETFVVEIISVVIIDFLFNKHNLTEN